MDDVLSDGRVIDYLDALHDGDDDLEKAMRAEGYRRDFPIIGPRVGRLCSMLAKAIGAKKVFEMGSGFGYSTLHFARTVGPGGRVVHTDGDKHRSREAKAWMTKAKVAARVEFRVGDALELLRKDRARYDIIFIDVDKEQYLAAWRIARTHVRKGGLVITDNTLWSNRVADPAQRDAATRGVRQYNEAAFADPTFLTTILPVRDGVAVSLKF